MSEDSTVKFSHSEERGDSEGGGEWALDPRSTSARARREVRPSAMGRVTRMLAVRAIRAAQCSASLCQKCLKWAGVG